jgi:molybdopterin converting factor small subunit
MIIHINLHTILQKQKNKSRLEKLDLVVPDGTTIEGLLKQLEITMPEEALLVIIKNHVYGLKHKLSDGDQVDLIPAISGGNETTANRGKNFQL